MSEPANAAVERIRHQLSAAYAAVIEELIEEAERDDHVAGLLLTGSLARGALGCSWPTRTNVRTSDYA